jgi:hypothetical protein
MSVVKFVSTSVAVATSSVGGVVFATLWSKGAVAYDTGFVMHQGSVLKEPRLLVPNDLLERFKIRSPKILKRNDDDDHNDNFQILIHMECIIEGTQLNNQPALASLLFCSLALCKLFSFCAENSVDKEAIDKIAQKGKAYFEQLHELLITRNNGLTPMDLQAGDITKDTLLELLQKDEDWLGVAIDIFKKDFQENSVNKDIFEKLLEKTTGYLQSLKTYIQKPCVKYHASKKVIDTLLGQDKEWLDERAPLDKLKPDLIKKLVLKEIKKAEEKDQDPNYGISIVDNAFIELFAGKFDSKKKTDDLKKENERYNQHLQRAKAKAAKLQNESNKKIILLKNRLLSMNRLLSWQIRSCTGSSYFRMPQSKTLL